MISIVFFCFMENLFLVGLLLDEREAGGGGPAHQLPQRYPAPVQQALRDQEPGHGRSGSLAEKEPVYNSQSGKP